VDGSFVGTDLTFMGSCGSGTGRSGGGGGGGLTPPRLPPLPPLKGNPNKVFSCADTAGYRLTQGLLGLTNLTLAGVKTAGLGGTDTLLAAAGPASGGATLVVAAVGTTYSVFTIQGQTVSGMGQLYSAISGDANGGEKITQAGDIISGPVSGLTTLIKTGNPSLAQRNANIENAVLLGPGLVKGKFMEKITSLVDLGLDAFGLRGAGCHP
jgi:hypothetical protein